VVGSNAYKERTAPDRALENNESKDISRISGR